VKNLHTYTWTIAGYSPTSWRMGRVLEQAVQTLPEIAPVPAKVPGSVQQALLTAGLIPDWNIGLNSRACEWVEQRDWIFATQIAQSDLAGSRKRLRCLGLDGYGLVFLNRVQVGSFANGYIPHVFDLSGVPLHESNQLEIVFCDLPRFNGTPYVSSHVRDLKARFNYTWDWMPRAVQIGIWDEIWLEIDEDPVLDQLMIKTDYDLATAAGLLRLQGKIAPGSRLAVELNGVGLGVYRSETLADGVMVTDLAVAPWQCNGRGQANLYPLCLELCDPTGTVVEQRQIKVGFKHVNWLDNKGAPDQADPWICELNGQPVFLAGVNWTPIRAHYADVSEADYRLRLETYKAIGFNVLRVWGGAFIEKSIFYSICDELGLLVWQEFPLSSSGPDNEPPADPETVARWAEVARSAIRRRRHHASLLLWCGGNELQTKPDGSPGIGLPLTVAHPMLKRLAEVCSEEDPYTRYSPSSSSGPAFVADPARFGQGRHWDVHGPWRIESDDYWDHDDALFRSETGAPGASSMDILNTYYPQCDLLPVSTDNVYWRRFFWWIDEATYEAECGSKPAAISQYVRWSQEHQARALTRALKACLKRFPTIGGMIIWMGHDAFPCLANTSILDFHGHMKPAAKAIQAILVEQKPDQNGFAVSFIP
jgi:beta-mannosidase